MAPRTKQRLSVTLCAAVIALAGCNPAGMGGGLSAGSLPETVAPVADAELLSEGQLQFQNGSYGNAARYFERLTRISPNDGNAWLGLAASYDRLRRFDLADRAYQSAKPLIGTRPEYLNNLGYSHLMRGDIATARGYLARAARAMPDDPTVRNNLVLLQNAVAL